MSEYTIVSGMKGVRYQKDKRFIARDKIPPAILEKLNQDMPVSDEWRDVQPPTKQCLYCLKEAKLSRVVNLQTVYLCDEDYYAKTIGQITQRIREYQNEQNNHTKRDERVDGGRE